MLEMRINFDWQYGLKSCYISNNIDEMKKIWLQNSVERSKSDTSNNVDSDIKYALKEYE